MAEKNSEMTPLTAEELKKSYGLLRSNLSRSVKLQKMGLTVQERLLLKNSFGEKLLTKKSDSTIINDFVTNSIVATTENINQKESEDNEKNDYFSIPSLLKEVKKYKKKRYGAVLGDR